MTKLLRISEEFIEEIIKQELTDVLEMLEAEIEDTELDMEKGDVPEYKLEDYGHNVMCRNALKVVLQFYGEDCDRKKNQREALDELAKQAQELGMY